MNNKEYKKAYKKAHIKNGRVRRKASKEIKKKFVEASNAISNELINNGIDNLSIDTTTEWRELNRIIAAGSVTISTEVEKVIPQAISDGYKNLLLVDERYILDACKIAKLSEITRAGLNNVGDAVLKEIIKEQSTRFAKGTGYTFKESVWSNLTTLSEDGKTKLPTSIYNDYQFRVENIIRSGLAQGRDAVKIAEDIQVYATKGKDAVFKKGRYGKLKPGTYEYRKRISRTVDWRSLRLVRSEMGASLQNAGKREGTLNPANRGWFDWIKTAGNPIDTTGVNNSSGYKCIELQRMNPWKEEEVPSYNHPNCGCSVVPVLMDHDRFMEELQDWTPGQGDSYLENWYNDVYLKEQ